MMGLLQDLRKLNQKMTYCESRLGDFLEEIIDQMKFIEEGYVTTRDMMKVIEEETGIRFE